MPKSTPSFDAFSSIVPLAVVVLICASSCIAASSACAGPTEVDKPVKRVIEIAEQLRSHGDYSGAYRVLYAARNGPDGTTKAALISLRGSIFQDLGRLDEAEVQYRRALRMLESLCGPEYRGLAPVLNDLGGLMLARGRVREAAKLCERSLELRQRYYPESDPLVLRGFENLGAVRLAQKQYAEARRLFEFARRGWELRNPGGPEAAIALNGLAVVAQRVGQRMQAVTLYREAIRRWPANSEPLLLAQIMGNLASIEEPQDAVAQYSEAIALVEKSAGNDHPTLAPLLERQTRCLRALHRKKEARETALRARLIRKSNANGLIVDQNDIN